MSGSVGEAGGTRPGAVAASVSDAAVAYVPRVLLEQLARAPGRALPWGEWVDGTLVMADVSGFTALSERLAQAGKEGAEWLTEVIDRFFGRMLDIAWDCGGTTLTFGGDAILLLFYGEDHERRGVAAALRMLHGTEELPAYRVGKHRVKLSMSMGAHAGRFLTTSAGTADSAQYLILGPETVKTALAEACASSGELAITPSLAERIADSAVLEPLDGFFRVTRLVDTPRYRVGPEAAGGPRPETDALAPYLPPFIAKVLQQAPDGPAPELDHEHRNVTVVFVNVLGVDDVLAADGADALTVEVQRYLEPVVRLVGENRGYLVSNDIYTNGFKLIVAFGAPVAHEHDAESALRFAAALRDTIDGLDLRLSHRIGVNGGFVFAGDVGPGYRRQYTVMGDAVNLAARLMSAAEPGQVIVSMRTAEAAGDCFRVRPLDPIRVKGKEHPVEIGLLEGECEPAAARADGATGFFGREDELAVLAQAGADAEDGNGRVVLVRGEAGMGKSRLTAEFERPLAVRGWAVLTGRAYEHTRGQPFAPWVPVLEAVTGLTADDDTGSRSKKVRAAVERAGPALAEWASLLNPLLRLSIPQTDLVRSLDAASRRDRMFDLVASLLRHACTSSPLLVHLEDAHWADSSSAGLIERVARDVPSQSLLLLITERFEGAPALDLPAQATRTIDLGELPREAALGLIGDALGVDLPRAAADALLAKTKGNPLFLQEVARTIGRSGMTADAEDDHDLARRVAGIDVPDRVQGLLMSQIDSLPSSARDVLRTASIVGTTFPVETLRGAFAEAVRPDDLEARLSELVAQSLLVDSSAGADRSYDFRHALIREVAYDSLPFAKRRGLHHRVAEYLEETSRAAPQQVYESLVHHYRLSGDRIKTRVFAVKAGDKARGLLASDQAIEFYGIGIDSVTARTPESAYARSCLLERIGDCYHVTGRHHHAARAYKDALARCRIRDARTAAGAGALLDLAQTPPARIRQAQLCHKIGVSFTRTHGDYARSLAWLERATRALPPNQAALGSRIDATRSVALLWTGKYEDAVGVAQRSYAAARRLGDSEVEARAATTLAGAFQELGALKRSARYRLVALESYRRADDVPGQAEAHSNLSACYICRGDLERALFHAREALKIDERTGDLTGEGSTRCNLAEILVMRGEYEEAIRHLQVALDLFARAGGVTHIMGFALVMMSRALTRSGRHAEAAARLEEAVALLKRSGATTFLAEARLQRAENLLASGQPEEALAQSERGLAEARSLGMRLMEIRGLWLRGCAAGALRHLAAAKADLEASEELSRRAAAPYERGLARLALAEICAANALPYRRALATALRLLEPTGATPDIERARRLRDGVTEG